MINSLYSPELLSTDYYMHVVVYYFKDWYESMPTEHRHDQVEIMYLMRGQCRVGTAGEIHTLRTGDFILLDANTSHRLIIDPNTSGRIMNIEFAFSRCKHSGSSLRELVASSPALQAMIVESQPYYLLKDSDEVYQALRSLINELDSMYEEKDLIVELMLNQLLVKIARVVACLQNPDDQRNSVHVKKALRFMQQNYDTQILVADIARAVSLNTSHLHRIFQASLGCTPIQYLTRLRMEKAKQLLTKTDIDIIDICSYIGISNRQYFTSLFKKHTGSTPNAYRLKP